MAGTFGGNPGVAADLAHEFASIRSSMQSLQGMFDAFDGATGSERIEKALDDFFAKSSDSRTALDGLLERAAGLLRAFAEGTAAVDQALRDSLAAADASAFVETQTPAVTQLRAAGPE